MGSSLMVTPAKPDLDYPALARNKFKNLYIFSETDNFNFTYSHPNFS